MSLVTLIIILVICLLAEGFFSGSEMAIVNAQKYNLAIQTDKGSRLARAALHLVKHPAIFFSTTLLGTNICTVTGSVVMTFYLISNYGEAYAPLAIIFWPFTLVFGEMVPKSVYQHYADKIVLKVAPVLFIFSWILVPIIWPLTKLTDFLLGGVKSRFGIEPPVTKEELELMMEMKDTASDVKPVERTMISRIFDLEDKIVENIMTPLVDVVSLPLEASREETVKTIEKCGYSRIPIYQGKVINVVGVLNGVDLLFSAEDKEIKDLIRPPYYIPENVPLDTLLITMKRRGNPLAIVVDEFGAATGIVTAEDVLEEVVGEIRDEHDIVSQLYQRIGHNRYIVSGRMEIEKANERLKLGIPPGDYETIAGFLLKTTERIPKAGESVLIGSFIYKILRATDKAVLEVEISRKVDKPS